MLIGSRRANLTKQKFAGVDLNGSTSQLRWSGLSLATPASGWSLAFWVNIDSLRTAATDTFVQSYASSTGVLFVQTSTSGPDNGLLAGQNFTTTSMYRVSAGALSTGLQHIAITHTGVTARTALKMYFDGTETTYAAGGQDGVGTSLGVADEQLLGYASHASGRELDGRMSDFGYWDAVLSSADVSLLAGGTPPQFVDPTNLVEVANLRGSKKLTFSGEGPATDTDVKFVRTL